MKLICGKSSPTQGGISHLGMLHPLTQHSTSHKREAILYNSRYQMFVALMCILKTLRFTSRQLSIWRVLQVPVKE